MNNNNIPQKSLIDLERDDTGKTPPLSGDYMAKHTRVYHFLKMSGVPTVSGEGPLPSPERYRSAADRWIET